MSFTAEQIARQLPGKHKRKGSGWMACCPVHEDPSPSLSLSDGRAGPLWHCFAGCSQDEVGRAIRDHMRGHEPAQPKRAAIKTAIKVEETHLAPPFDECRLVSLDTFATDSLGRPSMLWTYRDRDGQPLSYVARYETATGKEILPWAWLQRSHSAPSWRPRARPEDRPLYNLHKLHQRPNDPVIYVEGEKACDAAEKLFPAAVCVTHQGGGNALHKADLSPLYGRRHVIISPDADQPGENMAIELARALEGRAGVYRLNFPAVWPDGRPYLIEDGDDAADHVARGWTAAMLDPRSCVERFDFTAQLGDGQPDIRWFQIAFRHGEPCLLKHGSIVACVPLSIWRVIVGPAEAHFNDRLAAQRCPAGRLPRIRGSVDLAPFLGLELGHLMTLAAEHGPEAGLQRWLRRSFFGRQSDFSKSIAADRRMCA